MAVLPGASGANEQPVALGTTVGGPQIRNLGPTIPLGNPGQQQTVQQQVVTLANAVGSLLDLNLADRLDRQIDLFQDILVELRILNDLTVQAWKLKVDLDVEYRSTGSAKQSVVGPATL